MSDELKEEISRFSIRGYAEEHFKTQKKWGIFGRKAVKTSEIKMGYATKLAKPLTVLSKGLYKNALAMFQSIVTYMDKSSGGDASRGVQLFTLIRTYDQLRYSKNGLVEELYCQLIQQTTDNPSPPSLERGWEVMATFVYSGLLPQQKLLNVIIGHANSFRYAPSATGAFALFVHSVLCLRVRALREGGGAPDTHTPAQFSPLSDMSYEADVVPLRAGFIAEKVWPCSVCVCVCHQCMCHQYMCVSSVCMSSLCSVYTCV
jgi:hypothetical protein